MSKLQARTLWNLISQMILLSTFWSLSTLLTVLQSAIVTQEFWSSSIKWNTIKYTTDNQIHNSSFLSGMAENWNDSAKIKLVGRSATSEVDMCNRTTGTTSHKFQTETFIGKISVKSQKHNISVLSILQQHKMAWTVGTKESSAIKNKHKLINIITKTILHNEDH